MPEKLLVYVDGFNLYHGLHDAHKHRLLWLDLVMLAKALRPRSHLVAVKYFTATVLNEPAAQSRQDTYIAALKAMHPEQIEVVMGRYSQSTKVCRVCGAKHIHYEEKETDVNIAVNLVADASAKKADSFLIVSADSDVAPAVRMARSLNPRAFIAAAFPPMRFSAELKSLMPSSFHIAPSKFSASQLPQIVHGVGDITHHQPEMWRH